MNAGTISPAAAESGALSTTLSRQGTLLRRALKGRKVAALTPHERDAALNRLRRWATMLDSAFAIPGTKLRIGLDPLLGLVPAIGDGVAAFLSTYVAYQALRLGASKRTVLKMVFNIVVDFGMGSVPLVGDAVDVFNKANRRNVKLLEEELKRRTTT